MWGHHQSPTPCLWNPPVLAQERLLPIPGGWEKRCPFCVGSFRASVCNPSTPARDPSPLQTKPALWGSALPSLLRLRRAGWALRLAPPGLTVPSTSGDLSGREEREAVSPAVGVSGPGEVGRPARMLLRSPGRGVVIWIMVAGGPGSGWDLSGLEEAYGQHQMEDMGEASDTCKPRRLSGLREIHRPRGCNSCCSPIWRDQLDALDDNFQQAQNPPSMSVAGFVSGWRWGGAGRGHCIPEKEVCTEME